ncbi:protein tyrosine kinase [Dictyocaulus viviparus]|uniref:Protein tyrosine kinase n=1 Tax=Dictyocaulus viviparus TaxID=29172 RepID=A0A0D8Y782_DICVI|nr:protein tyrosine kinase [Dictyocaulus viviparus]
MLLIIEVCHPPSNDVSAANVLEARTSMINEAKIMAEYKSDYLIKFYGVACDNPPVMILMELCAGGSLDEHLRQRGAIISSTEKLVYLFETSKGMRYLHSVNCVHRDLAARNCLISSNGVVKVSDFGLSVILENGKTMCRTVIKEAPIRWFAPECCYIQPSFSKKTDVWAFGTLMFEVFSNGSKPFLNHNDMEIIRSIRKANMPPPPDGTPTTIVTLFKQIWELEPKCRPSFDDICKTLKEAIQISPPLSITDMIVNKLPGVKRTGEILPKSDVGESIGGSKSKVDADSSTIRTRSVPPDVVGSKVSKVV